MNPNSSDITASLAMAAAWIRQGQDHEAQSAPADLAAAVQFYDRALSMLRPLPLATHLQARRDYAGAWMNRGNALMKQATATSLVDAIAAYDEAIARLQTLPLAAHPAWANTLGAAWMNRGNALQQQGGAALPEAVRSYRAAIGVLEPLSANGERWTRLNLAASWMNLANALLLPPAADHCAARTAARHTLILIAPVESSDPLAADVGLKARRALGEAIGHLLVATDAERDAADLLADEAGEAMDGGLALVRHWESHGVTQHRELAARLYRLGAQLYLAHQPHFLAEFLLENLDSALKPGALADDKALNSFAAQFIPHAIATLRARPLLGLSLAAQQRLHEAVRDLESALIKLAELPSSSPNP